MRKRVFLPFEEARTYVRNLKIKTSKQWRKYCNSGAKPQNIPSNPPHTYKEFLGWGDWLGIVNAWNKSALLALLYDLRPRLNQLEEHELCIILQQGGALSALCKTLGGSSPLRVLRDL